MVPVEVLTSPACTTLPNFAFRVLVAIAAQYRGNNNGDLAMTKSIGRRFGARGGTQVSRSLALLEGRGLIRKTRQGGKKPLGPCLYALTWQPISELRNKIEVGPTAGPTNEWARWVEPEQKKSISTAEGADPAPPGVPIATISAPPKVPIRPNNGTAGGAPSRSPREGGTDPPTSSALNGGKQPSHRGRARLRKTPPHQAAQKAIK